MAGPLVASATTLSPPTPSATELAKPYDSSQDAPKSKEPNVTPRDPSLSSPEVSADRAPGESWTDKIEKEGLVKGVAFNWFQDLTHRMATVEKKVQDNEDRDNEGKTLARDLAKNISTMKRLPEVRNCNWDSFKNRYSPGEGIPAIEVLLAGHDLDREMEEEQLKRLDAEKRRDFMAADNKNPAKRTQSGKMTDTQRIERVRINSPSVLSLLAEVTDQTSWKGDEPHTFLKPFKIFVHFHEKMEKELENLADQYPDAGKPGPELERGPETIDTQPDPAIQAYLEIKCYVEFVRNRLLPIYHKFNGATDGTHTKVRFSELWFLFRVGDLIFESGDSKENRANTSTSRWRGTALQSSGRRLWKVCQLFNEDVNWTVDDLEIAGGSLRRNGDEDITTDFSVQAYRIDYNGGEYAAVSRAFSIFPFDGEKNITKLSVYPIRFQKDSNKVIKDLVDRGKKFLQLMGAQPRAIEHEGWTLVNDPSGERILRPDLTTRLPSEYISSDVIVDFEEAHQRHPAWQPTTIKYINIPWSPAVKHDLFPVIYWSNATRSHKISSMTETVVEDDDVDELEWLDFARTDNFIAHPESKLEAGGVVTQGDVEGAKQELTDEDVALLPARMFVYSLRDRRFINADVRSLKLPKNFPDPFGELRIPEQNKSLIRNIVLDHFEKKKIHRKLQSRLEETNSYEYEQDFIPRKGQGLVLLLHGAPGVGKTATAEAVAYAHKKPLFPITCGDLGTSPDVVERTLQDIFRLANMWDCVLLLDEAEIFLSRREKMDDSLKRNALVSTFLRTLEYYPGVLFLTTNRVGVLDEALNSRVHVSMFFDHLSRQQTLALFEMNARRCRMIADQRALVTEEPVLIVKAEEIIEFAEQKFEENRRQHPSKMPWWNGRQIRNAFQIATSLAYERETTGNQGGLQKYLGRAQFEEVLRIVDDYNKYRLEVHRKNEEELAHEREERRRPARHDPRRYEGQQEMGSRSPYGPSPYPQDPHSSTAFTPDRPLPGAYRSPHLDATGYGPRTPSRPYAETSSGSGYPPSQFGNMAPSYQYPHSREESANL